MTYTGKLYGRLGGAFVETGLHTSDVAELTAAVKRLEAKNARFRDALKPFAHDDLCALLFGNSTGNESIVFQRNDAVLTIGDFMAARAALEAQHAS